MTCEDYRNKRTEKKITGTLIRYNEDGSAVKPVQIQLVTDGEYHSAGTIDDMAVIDPANYQ